MRCVINSDDVTNDNRVVNLVIQIGKVVDRTRIGAIVDVEEAGDVIDSIVSIIAVQKRIKCCNFITNVIAISVARVPNVVFVVDRKLLRAVVAFEMSRS